MKKTFIILIMAVIPIFVTSCGSQPKTGNEKNGTVTLQSNVYYTCPMHPEVRSDKPGTCPKCGMELVKKEIPMSDSGQAIQQADTIKLQ